MMRKQISRVVIVGGVAGGATAAARLARLDNTIAVSVLERGPDVSFANCGLPYHIGNEITDRSALLLHTPETLKKSIGVHDVRVRMNVTQINREARTVSATDLTTGSELTFPYDALILSPGASPLVPPLPGIRHPKIFTLRNMQDMDKLKAAVSAPSCRRVTVVGAGFIGLEMAEQLVHMGKAVTIVEKAPTVLPQADTELGAMLHPVIRAAGITLKTNDGLKGFSSLSSSSASTSDDAAPLSVELESGATIEADVVVLSIGVRPDTALAKACGLTLSARGHIVVDPYMRTSDASIYAVGDAVETNDFVFPEHQRAWVPLGNVANMQARVAADHIASLSSPPSTAASSPAPGPAATPLPYQGSIGTAIVRCFDWALAVTGWTEHRLRAAGIPHAVSIINAWDHASYYPGAECVTLKLTYCPTSGRIFGGQVAGLAKAGIDKRADVIATALLGRLTIDALSQGQFAYAPPFGSAKDPVNLACLNARNIRDGLLHAATRIDPDATLIDVRPAAAAASDPLVKTLANQKVSNIYFADMYAQAPQLDKGTPYQSMCLWGRTSYFAHRAMRQAGLQCTSVQGGAVTARARDEATQSGAPVETGAGEGELGKPQAVSKL